MILEKSVNPLSLILQISKEYSIAYRIWLLYVHLHKKTHGNQLIELQSHSKVNKWQLFTLIFPSSVVLNLSIPLNLYSFCFFPTERAISNQIPFYRVSDNLWSICRLPEYRQAWGIFIVKEIKYYLALPYPVKVVQGHTQNTFLLSLPNHSIHTGRAASQAS